MNKKYVVVGGGIAGLFSAIYLAQKGCQVTLIEKADEVGGLLRSKQLFHDDMYFDYGTHIPQETGIANVDNILFSGLEGHEFQVIKAGSYKGSLFEGNGFLSDCNLSEDVRAEALSELKKARQVAETEFSNLEEQLKESFGQVYYTQLLEGSITKILHCPPSKLAPDAHLLFGLSRIVVANPELTRELKRVPKLDQVLAFHSYNEGVSGLKAMYPISGGVGAWIDLLRKKATDLGVAILTGCTIKSLVKDEDFIKAVVTDQGSFDIDGLVWTIPVFMLMQFLDIQPEKASPPKLLTSAIFHFVIDKSYLSKLFYLQCYDESMSTFRVTLYNNFVPRKNNNYMVTSEVLLNNAMEDFEALKLKVFEELKEMKIIPNDSQILDSDTLQFKNSFPVPTPEFLAHTSNQMDIVKGAVKNLDVFGRGGGKKWFMKDVLLDAFRQLEAKH